ncbi:hypothetical protein L218DRAFT_283548 [Marasmius fiardii PR-910]|nr:hypothetical protein L218DRAFT_283548 [Marasmius fiardii PR-910]
MDDPRCSRPDCDQHAPNEFFVSRLIGRRTKIIDGEKSFVWLILWLGYPVCKATWESEDSFNDPRLIEQFDFDVEAEDIGDDRHSCIMLQEAFDGGWNPEEPDVIPLDTSREMATFLSIVIVYSTSLFHFSVLLTCPSL